MRWLVVSVVLALAASSAAAGPGITITQDSDPAVTLGDAVIDGDPADVFAEVSDFRKWAQIMPDVANVEIHGQRGNEAQVTLVSPSGHRDNLHFRNTPANHIVWFEDTGNGGRADVWHRSRCYPPASREARTCTSCSTRRSTASRASSSTKVACAPSASKRSLPI
jgi:hypothetical protein